MGGSNTISTSETRAEALQLQSSAYGVTIPWVHGVNRVAANLLDYLNFQGIPHTTSQEAGKGGSSRMDNTTYTYQVSAVMGICHGPASVLTLWRGKQSFPASSFPALGITVIAGNLGQAVWSPLNTLAGGTHADPYSGITLACAENYNLGNSPSVENHNFEVAGYRAYAIGPSVLDTDTSLVAYDWLTDTVRGCRIPAGELGSLTSYSNYSRAAGLLLSPDLTEQARAAERIAALCDLTNAQLVCADGLIHIVPLGDEALTANGATYTPDLTPIYDLTPDDLVCADGDLAVRTKRKTPADAYNIVKVEFRNRANAYAKEVATARDQASVDLYGERPAPTISTTWICDPAVANRVAWLKLKQYRYCLNTYEFDLPWQYAALLPTNIVTLTEPTEGLDRTPVRVVSITDTEKGYTVEAVDFPSSVGSTPAYTFEQAGGYLHNWNADPGDARAPVFVEPPVELTTTGLEVWIATAGNSSTWGGAQVWVSWTGSDYRLADTIHGGARYGSLTAAFGAADTTAAVQLNDTTRQLLTGSSTDAATLATLCRVKASGQPPEFLAYTTASLTGAGAYTLGGLVRGAYDSGPHSHTTGASFVRLDASIAKSGPLDPDVIGKTLHVKLVSFNIYGGGLQDISAVPEYTYQITGEMALLPPANVSSFTLTIQADGTRQFDWHWGTQAKPADLQGYVVRFRQGTGPYTWDELQPFNTDDGFHTASPIESNLLLAGSYVFAIKAIDKWGVLSTAPLIINATLPDPRLGNAVEFFDYFNLGWPSGTLTDCVRDTWDGELILRARDQATWTTVPGTISAWTRWVWDPVTTFTYETPAVDFGAVISTLPVAQIVAEGDTTFQAATSADGSTWGSWAAVAGPLLTRYAKTRITVTIPSGSSTGAGITPICTLKRFAVTWVGKVSSETVNDVDPTTFSGTHRLAAGHYRLPLQHTWVHISRLTVTIQNVTSNWGWTPVDKYHADGPEIKIYNGAGTLADPPLIDYTIEGISS